MDLRKFIGLFELFFPDEKKEVEALSFEDGLAANLFDPYPLVPGMTSGKKLQLLNLSVSCLEAGEGYLEIGTWLGKSLLSALYSNPVTNVYACDNFSEFDDGQQNRELLFQHLKQYDPYHRVTFFDGDFRKFLNPHSVPTPIGVYLYDAAHDLQSQYDGIKLVEPLLSDRALVIVDDWRHAEDSLSYAREGTLKAMGESINEWQLLYELPARFNGDQATWWNGVGVCAFQRVSALG